MTGAFAGCKQLTTVHLNEGLNFLGTACCNTGSLQNNYWLNLAINAQKLDEDDDDYAGTAFPGVFEASGLREIDVPGSVETLSPACFRNCRRLERVVLHSGLQTIGERCFRGAGLTSVDILPTVKTIGERAFARTFGLRDFRLAPSPGGLDLGAFVLQHSAVRSCDFGNRISELPYGMFWGCRSLRELILPPGLRRLSAACFRDSDVERVEVPAGLEEIGSYAFQNCVRLREISFANDSVLRRVDMGAFERSGLESFSAPKSLRVIGSGAFYRCDRLREV